jgi:hypothetical protein
VGGTAATKVLASLFRVEAAAQAALVLVRRLDDVVVPSLWVLFGGHTVATPEPLLARVEVSIWLGQAEGSLKLRERWFIDQRFRAFSDPDIPL